MNNINSLTSALTLLADLSKSSQSQSSGANSPASSTTQPTSPVIEASGANASTNGIMAILTQAEMEKAPTAASVGVAASSAAALIAYDISALMGASDTSGELNYSYSYSVTSVPLYSSTSVTIASTPDAPAYTVKDSQTDVEDYSQFGLTVGNDSFEIGFATNATYLGPLDLDIQGMGGVSAGQDDPSDINAPQLQQMISVDAQVQQTNSAYATATSSVEEIPNYFESTPSFNQISPANNSAIIEDVLLFASAVTSAAL
jgi:hypothetical protein